MDPAAGTFLNFVNRSLKNIENRCLHQHVFDDQLILQMFQYFNISILSLTTAILISPNEQHDSYIALGKINKILVN